MIDTVRFDYHGSWRPNLPPGWRIRDRKDSATTIDEEVPVRFGRILTHEESGLRVGGSPETARWVEVSLLRLLLGSNGKMLRTEKQLDEAINAALALAWTVARLERPRDPLPCTRLDLVGQFLIEPEAMIVAHRVVNHPRIRGGKVHYEGESLHFVGKERHCRVYDKMREMEHRPGHVTRVEWQLQGEALRHDMDQNPVDLMRLTMEGCYATYRDLCLQFTPASLPKRSTIYDLLAECVHEGTTLNGIPLLDWYLRGKHGKAARRIRQEIAKRRAETFGISWAGLLPEQFADFKMVDALPDPAQSHPAASTKK